jgi:hypothetical protein
VRHVGWAVQTGPRERLPRDRPYELGKDERLSEDGIVAKGDPRTACSLWHTYICMRLMEGADTHCPKLEWP